jgi:glycosyltransferase involved in cell wall biosynthesis
MTALPPAERKTKVLHILSQLNPSGMERMLVSGTAYFQQLNCESYVLGQGAIHPYQADLVAAGYHVRIHERTLRSPQGRRQLRRLIREENIDVVHIHPESNYLATVLTAASALRGRGIIVRTIHNVFRPRGRVILTRFFQALIADRFVAHLIAPSSDVAHNERRFFRSPAVILNWVDDRFFEIAKERSIQVSGSDSEHVPVALIVGNCSEIKRHELAVAAVLHAGHQLMHIGSESVMQEKERVLLEKVNAKDDLLLRGAQSPDAAFLAADYYLMSSKNEGMPVALAEALVVGLPCYVADVPGLRWSADSPSVTMLPESQTAWNDELASLTWDETGAVPRQDTFDFSAKRGATDYVDIYRNHEIAS